MKLNKISILITALLLFTMACLCTNTSALPSVPTVQPPLAENTAVPPVVRDPVSSGIITQVIMAKDTQGVELEPVDPTTVFGSTSVIHAVIKIEDAPANTKFTAEFYVVDVGDAAAPNSLITSTDLVGDGTRYIDFTLTPTTSWPAGTYRVDISVNGQFDQSAVYTVQ